MEVVIGTVAGVLVTMLCTAFYTKGIKDGSRVRTVRRKKTSKEEEPAVQAELARKFDAILDYDPYGTDNGGKAQGESA